MFTAIGFATVSTISVDTNIAIDVARKASLQRMGARVHNLEYEADVCSSTFFKEEKAVGKYLVVALLLGLIASPVVAEERTWRNDILPIFEANCNSCHGPEAPEYNEWRLLSEEEQKTVGPRMDTYPHFMSYVVWPATGAMMRRLDDATHGNMYENLGETDVERTENLAIIKEWLGEGAWNLNRWKARKEAPGIAKEQLENIKAKY